MDDPAELTESNLALKQRMRHCECQMRGICSTCVYFINAELEEMEVTEHERQNQRNRRNRSDKS